MTRCLTLRLAQAAAMGRRPATERLVWGRQMIKHCETCSTLWRTSGSVQAPRNNVAQQHDKLTAPLLRLSALVPESPRYQDCTCAYAGRVTCAATMLCGAVIRSEGRPAWEGHHSKILSSTGTQSCRMSSARRECRREVKIERHDLRSLGHCSHHRVLQMRLQQSTSRSSARTSMRNQIVCRQMRRLDARRSDDLGS